MPIDARQRLIAVLRALSVKRERVILASGRESDFYADVRQTTLNAEGAALVAGLVLDRLKPGIVGVGGPVTGADPIAGAVAALSWLRGTPLHGFMVRKEPKGHGLRQWIEGRASLPDGSAVCVVEDTTTTGGSLLTAIKRIEEEGLLVAQCITVVDRQEGAAERLAERGYLLEPLVTRQDLET